MEIFKTNQNKAERILRLIVSLFLIPAPIILGSSAYSFRNQTNRGCKDIFYIFFFFLRLIYPN